MNDICTSVTAVLFLFLLVTHIHWLSMSRNNFKKKRQIFTDLGSNRRIQDSVDIV